MLKIMIITLLLLTGCICVSDNYDASFCEEKNSTIHYSDVDYIKCIDDKGEYHEYSCNVAKFG